MNRYLNCSSASAPVRTPLRPTPSRFQEADTTSVAVTLYPTNAVLLSGRRGFDFGFAFVWLLTFVIYARPEDMFPVVAPLHLTFIFATCAALVCGLSLMLRRALVPWTVETKLVLLLTAWFVIGIPFAFWKAGSLNVFTHVWTKTVLVYLLLTIMLRTLVRIEALLWAIILSELLATMFSILQPSRALWVGERIYGANTGFLGWNFLGIAAAMTIPYIAAIFVIRRSALSTSLLVATSLSMLWMLILTASRGGFLNVIFSAGLTSILVLRGSYRGKIAGLGIALVLLLGVVFAPPVFWDRIGTLWKNPDTPTYTSQFRSGLEELAAEESTEGRLELLHRSIQYTIDHPLFGLGLGNFSLSSGAQHSADPNAWMGTHNTFTQISSEAGLPALIIYLAVIAITVRSLSHIRRRIRGSRYERDLGLMASATLVSVLSFVFGACVAHLAYDYYFFYIVAIAVALRCIAREFDTKAKHDEQNVTPLQVPAFAQ